MAVPAASYDRLPIVLEKEQLAQSENQGEFLGKLFKDQTPDVAALEAMSPEGKKPKDYLPDGQAVLGRGAANTFYTSFRSRNGTFPLYSDESLFLLRNAAASNSPEARATNGAYLVERSQSDPDAMSVGIGMLLRAEAIYASMDNHVDADQAREIAEDALESTVSRLRR